MQGQDPGRWDGLGVLEISRDEAVAWNLVEGDQRQGIDWHSLICMYPTSSGPLRLMIRLFAFSFGCAVEIVLDTVRSPRIPPNLPELLFAWVGCCM